jgi:hypothetical protein
MLNVFEYRLSSDDRIFMDAEASDRPNPLLTNQLDRQSLNLPVLPNG